MSNLQQVREGLSKAWDTITIGWRELRELAGEALTRFYRDDFLAQDRGAPWA